MTRIVATSDLHGHLPEIPACDLLLVGGDVCPVENHERKFQAKWLRSEFSEWIMESPAEEVVWIAGNHDFTLEFMAKSKTNKLPGYYLQDETVRACDLVIHGVPWTPTFGNWAFMKPDQWLSEKWALIPEDVDIILSHGPFFGQHDAVPKFTAVPVKDDKGKVRWGWQPAGEDRHTGSASLLNRLTYSHYPNLKLFFCGHIHEGYGSGEFKGRHASFKTYNVSHMDGGYKPNNPPVVIDL